MVAPPVFDGEDYQVWAVRMEAFLEACDLWDAVEEDYEVPPLPGNPTVAQIKTHKERKTKKSKAKNCLFAAVSSTIFSKIMTLGSAKAIWDFLKNEYKGDERIKGMKVLNLVREFEMQHMKESETVKAYVDRLSGIANKATHLLKVLCFDYTMGRTYVSRHVQFEESIFPYATHNLTLSRVAHSNKLDWVSSVIHTPPFYSVPIVHGTSNIHQVNDVVASPSTTQVRVSSPIVLTDEPLPTSSPPPPNTTSNPLESFSVSTASPPPEPTAPTQTHTITSGP
ncbi:hypothetical protein GH714_029983 [Hevea brasiliensis]|uniref:Uncharacterized protein n=1 Tax=Hevea brasiliensis TaxID=3981 RepID=A0A6A6LEM0_HEVBR|nr:hypothetical protein GH714_029983 [Hevea brasiliensis]